MGITVLELDGFLRPLPLRPQDSVLASNLQSPEIHTLPYTAGHRVQRPAIGLAARGVYICLMPIPTPLHRVAVIPWPGTRPRKEKKKLE